MSARKLRWYPPPPPSPKILHFPRRIRRTKTVKPVAARYLSAAAEPGNRLPPRGKLESLFDQEKTFSRSVPIGLLNSGHYEARERVGEGRNRRGDAESEEEKWKFEAEFLRAECNFLRMEREVALKKLERNRIQMEKMLQSAVETLISGRKKVCEGKNAGIILQEEIEEVEEMLKELRSSSRGGDYEIRKCSNFDKKASILRRRIENLGSISEEKKCVREIREMAEASLRIESKCSRSEKRLVSARKHRLADVEVIRRKMEGLSRAMLERMEEYGGMLGTTTNSSADATSKRIEYPETEERWCGEEKGGCSGRCKAIVKKIVEQVKAESEQWSQMQAMLGRVREEMEELQASRDLWQDRALESQTRLQAVQSDVHEWKQRAQLSESKVCELETQISQLRIEVARLRSNRSSPEIPQEIENAWGPARMKGLDRALDSQKEKEKRVLICRLKENSSLKSEKRKGGGEQGRRSCSCETLTKRSPLQEIGNSSSPLIRQSRSVFPLHSPQPSRLESR